MGKTAKRSSYNVIKSNRLIMKTKKGQELTSTSHANRELQKKKKKNRENNSEGNNSTER